MAPIAIKENTLLKGIRPHYTLEQRTVKKNKNQSIFVPLNQLPEELNASINEDRIELILKYSMSEDTLERLFGDSITVKLGVNTGRLFSLILSFQKHNFVALLQSFDKIENCLNKLKKEAPRDTLRKNYDLISASIQIIKNEILKKQDSIMSDFAQKS